MVSINNQAKRRLKQLGATLDPSKAGWSDSEDEDLIQEGEIENMLHNCRNSGQLKLFYSWYQVSSYW